MDDTARHCRWCGQTPCMAGPKQLPTSPAALREAVGAFTSRYTAFDGTPMVDHNPEEWTHRESEPCPFCAALAAPAPPDALRDSLANRLPEFAGTESRDYVAPTPPAALKGA